jgi:hypothetical protein
VTSDAVGLGPRQPSRIVVSDDGFTVQVLAYDAPDAVPTVVLVPPLRCLHLAAELLAAGIRHLSAQRNHVAGARRGPP